MKSRAEAKRASSLKIRVRWRKQIEIQSKNAGMVTDMVMGGAAQENWTLPRTRRKSEKDPWRKVRESSLNLLLR